MSGFRKVSEVDRLMESKKKQKKGVAKEESGEVIGAIQQNIEDMEVLETKQTKEAKKVSKKAAVKAQKESEEDNMKQISFKLSKDLYARLEAKAKSKELNTASLMRMVLREYVDME